jgi:hypothetical protein
MQKKLLSLPSSSKTQLAAVDNQAREMGSQLTEQFGRATDGMREVLIFGAMMMRLRELIISNVETLKNSNISNVETLKHSIRTGGPGAKDSGVKAWLERYAPAVPQSSAHRFEAVALAAQNLWTGLPDTLARKIEFPELVTKAERELSRIDRRLPGKQKELFDFARGFSQKSLLDTYVEKHGRGGNQYSRGGGKGKRRKLSAAALEKQNEELCRSVWTSLVENLPVYLAAKNFRYLDDAELDSAIDEFSSALSALRDWRKTPKSERDAIARAALAQLAKQTR